MTDRLTSVDFPLYLPVEHLSFAEWANLIKLRAERINKLVAPRLQREFERLDVSAIRFLQTAIERLSWISQRRFTNEGNPPPENSIFCLLNEQENGSDRYNLDGIRGVHEKATLAAAQALIDALCPEQGIDINMDWQTLVQRAEQAQTIGYAETWNTGRSSEPDQLSFPTILPGITLDFSHLYNQRRYISLAELVM